MALELMENMAGQGSIDLTFVNQEFFRTPERNEEKRLIFDLSAVGQ